MKHSDLTNVFLTTEMKIAVVKVSGLDTYSTAYITRAHQFLHSQHELTVPQCILQPSTASTNAQLDS